MRLFKMRSEVDQLLYPEMLGKVIIINTPSLFSYVYSMLAPMLDARTRSKVRPATVPYRRCASFAISAVSVSYNTTFRSSVADFVLQIMENMLNKCCLRARGG